MFNNLSIIILIGVIISGFLVGFAKTSFGALGTIPAIIICASIFPIKESTGVVLMLLIIGDVFALFYYRKHINFNQLFKVLPYALIGIAVASICYSYIDDRLFKQIMSIILIICLALMMIQKKSRLNQSALVNSKFFSIIMGALTGFTSTIGNLAGPIYTIYLLSLDIPKNDYIGLNAIIFAILNIIKLMIQIFLWNNIKLYNIAYNILAIPFVMIGALIGLKIVKNISQNLFNKIILVVSLLSSIYLFIQSFYL